MEQLTAQSLYRAVTKCQSDYNYRVLVVTNSVKQRDFVFKELCLMNHSEHARYLYHVRYDTGSSITVLTADPRVMHGRRADLVLFDPELYSPETLSVFKVMEAKNNSFFKT